MKGTRFRCVSVGRNLSFSVDKVVILLTNIAGKRELDEDRIYRA